jgi:hypothetical protein
MPCKLKQRKDDIPKRRGEKSWVCEECNTLVISAVRPRCTREMEAEVAAHRAAAKAELEVMSWSKP